MGSFVLREPITALQYVLNDNETQVMDLIRSTGRTGMSMNNMRGYLHVLNGGPELRVQPGAWVVAIGTDVAILSDERFRALFHPA